MHRPPDGSLALITELAPMRVWENDDLPALAPAAALGLIDYFIWEHDLVEESWLRTACWIGGNFDVLGL